MEPTLIRAIERLLGVVVGGVAIYLGYRLFLKLPVKTNSSGKVILPGGISVYLSRIGPGAFFALFGAIVVAISFHKSIETTRTTGPIGIATNGFTSTQQVQFATYRGVGDTAGSVDDPHLVNRRADVRGTIAILNSVAPAALPAGTARARDYGNAIRDSKLALLREVWADDWGSFDEFRAWVIERDQTGPLPARCDEPRRILHQGTPTTASAP